MNEGEATVGSTITPGDFVCPTVHSTMRSAFLVDAPSSPGLYWIPSPDGWRLKFSPMFESSELAPGADGYVVGAFVCGLVLAKVEHSLFVLDSASRRTGWVYAATVEKML